MWLKERGYRIRKVDLTEEFLRFRQTEPSRGKYYTKVLPDGVRLVYHTPDRTYPMF